MNNRWDEIEISLKNIANFLVHFRDKIVRLFFVERLVCNAFFKIVSSKLNTYW